MDIHQIKEFLDQFSSNCLRITVDNLPAIEVAYQQALNVLDYNQHPSSYHHFMVEEAILTHPHFLDVIFHNLSTSLAVDQFTAIWIVNAKVFLALLSKKWKKKMWKCMMEHDELTVLEEICTIVEEIQMVDNVEDKGSVILLCIQVIKELALNTSIPLQMLQQCQHCLDMSLNKLIHVAQKFKTDILKIFNEMLYHCIQSVLEKIQRIIRTCLSVQQNGFGKEQKLEMIHMQIIANHSFPLGSMTKMPAQARDCLTTSFFPNIVANIALHPFIHCYPNLIITLMKCFTASIVPFLFSIDDVTIDEQKTGLVKQHEVVVNFLKHILLCINDEKLSFNIAQIRSMLASLAPMTISFNDALRCCSRNVMSILIGLDSKLKTKTLVQQTIQRSFAEDMLTVKAPSLSDMFRNNTPSQYLEFYTTGIEMMLNDLKNTYLTPTGVANKTTTVQMFNLPKYFHEALEIILDRVSSPFGGDETSMKEMTNKVENMLEVTLLCSLTNLGYELLTLMKTCEMKNIRNASLFLDKYQPSRLMLQKSNDAVSGANGGVAIDLLDDYDESDYDGRNTSEQDHFEGQEPRKKRDQIEINPFWKQLKKVEPSLKHNLPQPSSSSNSHEERDKPSFKKQKVQHGESKLSSINQQGGDQFSRELRELAEQEERDYEEYRKLGWSDKFLDPKAAKPMNQHQAKAVNAMKLDQTIEEQRKRNLELRKQRNSTTATFVPEGPPVEEATTALVRQVSSSFIEEDEDTNITVANANNTNPTETVGSRLNFMDLLGARVSANTNTAANAEVDQLQTNKYVDMVKRINEHNAAQERRLEDMQIAKELASVSADPIFREILSLRMSELKNQTASANQIRNQTGSLPVKFLGVLQYINAFTPLLIEEFKAALLSLISNDGHQTSSLMDGNEPLAYNNHRRDRNGSQSKVKVFPLKFVSSDQRENKELHECTFQYDQSDNSMQQSDSENTRDLQKDDLVVLIKAATTNFDLQRKDLIDIKNHLGIVFNVPKRSHINNNNNNNTYTILLNSGFAGKEGKVIHCISLMNISTFLREWNALHSISNYSLFPLTPYLLQASPAISASRLSVYNENMKKQMESLEKKKILVSNFHTDSTRVQFEQLLALLEQLSTVHINGLLLKSTGIVKTLQAIQKNVTEAFSVELVNKATELISNWKLQITTEEKRTNQNYKGGKIAIIPSSKDEIPCPETISNVLWEKLRGAYNVSQLYAISYVVQKLDERHDTRVALIQGPPGTGKTSTILGLVSALLHASKSKQQNTERKANNEQDSDNLEAESNSSSSSTVEPKVTTLKRRLLICAPSNAAIDEVLTRIKLTGIYDDAQHSFFHGVNASNSERRPVKLVRLGEPLEGASTVVQQLVLENQVEASIKQKAEYHRLQEAIHILKEAQYNVEEYRKEHPEVRNYVPQRQGANNTNQPPEDKLSNSYKHLKELLGLVNHYKRERDESAIALDMLRNRTRVEVLVDAEVVGTTLSSSGKNQFIDYIIQQNITFETVIIDEAGQTTEPGTLLPLRFGCKNLILVGDPRQLPATVNSRFAEANGLGRSLFERLEQAEHEVVMLTVQYRMHPEIRSFPSAQFYQNKLTDGPHITKEVEDIKNIVMEGSVVSTMLNTLQIPPVIFFDSCKKTYLQGNMAGLNNNDIMENKEGNSFRNVYECEQIIHLLAILLPKLKGKLSIAIISPYKEQVNMILQKCKQHSQIGYEMKQRVDESNRIEINSVDGFQGREKDVVIFSSVRCNNIVSPHVPKVIGFLADERRLNVAITRAKKSLIIFGNSATLSVDKMWMNMIQSLEERNAIRHGREGLYKLPASL